jgi:hypothetical protein
LARTSVPADGEDGIRGQTGAARALLAPGSRDIEHISSAHDDAELEILKAVAQRLAAGQGELNLGLGFGGQGPAGRCRSRPRGWGHLLDALGRACDLLGFAQASAGYDMFRQLVLARIIEPASKLDSLRVLEEAGLEPGRTRRSSGACRPTPRLRGGTSCPRRVPRTLAWARPAWCCLTSAPLYFETDTGDGFREPGCSKERWLEPQITIGLLTDQAGFPLIIETFEGNKPETRPCSRSSPRSWPPTSCLRPLSSQTPG